MSDAEVVHNSCLLVSLCFVLLLYYCLVIGPFQLFFRGRVGISTWVAVGAGHARGTGYLQWTVQPPDTQAREVGGSAEFAKCFLSCGLLCRSGPVPKAGALPLPHESRRLRGRSPTALEPGWERSPGCPSRFCTTAPELGGTALCCEKQSCRLASREERDASRLASFRNLSDLSEIPRARALGGA